MTDDDRDEGSIMSNWTDGDLAKVAAEELATAMRKQNLGYAGVDPDDDRVVVDFYDLSEASALLSLLFRNPAGPGTLYDRATAGCVSVAALSDQYGDEAPHEDLVDIFQASWVWQIHPVMTSGRVVTWHAHVTMSADDAMTVAAALNSGVRL